MEYKVLINIEGKTEEKSFGKLITDGKNFKLFYTLDGDECILQNEDGSLHQSRKGVFNTEILFNEGKKTVCRIEDGGLCGEIPVYTDKIFREFNGADLKIKLYYSMGGEDCELKITACAVREKK